MDLASGESRLEDTGSIQTALRTSGTHDSVELVDEQDDLGVRAQLGDDRLEPLFEVSPVARAGHYRSYVQRNQPLVPERGDAAFRYLQRETFHDRGLTHAGLADQQSVILTAPAEYLYDPADLLLPSVHRVQRACGGQCAQVRPVFFDRKAGGVRLRLRAVLAAFRNAGEKRSGVHTLLLQELVGAGSLVAAYREQQMERTRLRLAQFRSLQHGDTYDPLAALAKAYLVHTGVRYAFAEQHPGVQINLGFRQVHSQLREHRAGFVAAVPEEPQEKMVDLYAVAACAHRLFPRQAQYFVYFV